MDKKHLCSRKQPYPQKSAILMPVGHTCGLQAKAIPPVFIPNDLPTGPR